MTETEEEKLMIKTAEKAMENVLKKREDELQKMYAGKFDEFSQATQAKLEEQAATFTALVETLREQKAAGVEMPPEIMKDIQNNIIGCVRGECRRLGINVNEIKGQLTHRLGGAPPGRVPPGQNPAPVPPQTAPPPQAPAPQPAPPMYSCQICHQPFQAGLPQCTHCGTKYTW